MSVVAGADRIDVALDEIAAAMQRPHDDLPEQISVALTCMALWRVVFKGAMTNSDGVLAGVAGREWRHARNTYRALQRMSDVRGPPL